MKEKEHGGQDTGMQRLRINIYFYGSGAGFLQGEGVRERTAEMSRLQTRQEAGQKQFRIARRS
jgi:hypothetical protein